jgi:hypothetical protein
MSEGERVMAGLVPAIHVFGGKRTKPDVDARHEAARGRA